MTCGAVYALDVAFDVRLLSPKDLISVVSQLYSNDGQLGSSPYSQGEAGKGLLPHHVDFTPPQPSPTATRR